MTLKSDHPLLNSLNPSQQEAVLTTEGPVLILAGAGSGKTRTLTHRIAYLIAEKKVSPFSVLAVTFTNKAAGEMKKRVLNLLYGQQKADFLLNSIKGPTFNHPDLPVIGTFHSFCVQILRKYLHLLGFENQFAIYDDTDSQILMKTIMREQGLSTDRLNPKAILSHISGAKNALLTPTEYAKQAYSTFTQTVADLYPIYQKKLSQNQALDFDDIIMKTVELFEKEPQVLADLQERFQYISVDEYQDTNHAQFILINKLAHKYRNLCVVGDDWQSIYSWRGATMQNILDFEKDYPEAKTVKLEQNYRSTSIILDASHSVIAKNKKRTDKKLWTNKEKGPKIQIWQALDERAEGGMIAAEIQKILLQYEAPSYRDFAILYRTNAQSRVIEETMLRYGIPYRVVGGVKFYERKEIKDILAYLKLIVNPADSVSLLRIINIPPRKIGSKTLEALQTMSRHQGDVPLLSIIQNLQTMAGNKIELNEGKTVTLGQFVKLISVMQKINHQYPASGVIKNLLEESKYKEFLLDGSTEGETRYENVQELISVASKYDKLEPGLSLATFLEEVALISDLDQFDDRDNAVVLMTMHMAKGLEFPNVFIAGLEEGIFPHSRSLFEPNELEEERRLMYVGMTRAMERLYLLYAERRLLYGDIKCNSPSQFLRDLPAELCESNDPKNPLAEDGIIMETEAKEGILANYFGKINQQSGLKRIPVENEIEFYPDEIPDPVALVDQTEGFLTGQIPNFSQGDRVRHRTFGEGVVVKVTGGILTIAFSNPQIGVKKLASSVAPLKKIKN
ncbi:MAG: ATP-dependent DNA helicase, DNA helicase II / ATP-dependent DNA helicase PcrA [Candidatus Peregrinibacteria bacterium GW2011_GWE2_39_6]|nr:MAG: ATP-dependent DNA helicase, DNA helicase II / ATP-dependent DNA helicase PcrA [Candidatus Peregrinibacteria bacterium GW2011_GWF2_39_17]KKR25931.1 MAG: ATP-dependent DNA helicase, DNA helicase II / ATP-dependent DNA helicase PcrA [Candidatus Peregrinibacteria bacterium GW2011_GWE2_39_6]HCW32363.1 ATP-dependent DNA helicase PcrA [Candidatus Peregrinibacteria bacterium]